MASERITASVAGAREYLSAHPEEARYRDSPATAVVEDGLRVRVTGPDGASITTDMVSAVGGAGSAPSPGWLFRAAYASCVATLITLAAAVEGVELTELVVTVDSESDDRGILGIDATVPPGPLSIRVAVRIAAAGEDEGRLRALVDWGSSHCPVDDLVRRSVPVELGIEVG